MGAQLSADFSVFASLIYLFKFALCRRPICEHSTLRRACQHLFILVQITQCLSDAQINWLPRISGSQGTRRRDNLRRHQIGPFILVQITHCSDNHRIVKNMRFLPCISGSLGTDMVNQR